MDLILVKWNYLSLWLLSRLSNYREVFMHLPLYPETSGWFLGCRELCLLVIIDCHRLSWRAWYQSSAALLGSVFVLVADGDGNWSVWRGDVVVGVEGSCRSRRYLCCSRFLVFRWHVCIEHLILLSARGTSRVLASLLWNFSGLI